MYDKKAIGNSKIRDKHRLDVLNLIRKSGSISRTDICKETELSKATVTRIIETLLKENIVKETGIGESAAGRKPVYIELNPSAFYCIGINISRSKIRASLIDLSMRVLVKEVVDIVDIETVEGFTDSVKYVIDMVIKTSGIEVNKLLGLGVGIRGIVDVNRGVIVDFDIGRNLVNIDLKRELEETFNLPVFIDSNANTRVLGEYWYGFGVGYKNIIYVICSEGVGSGIIVDGTVLRGKSNVIGEFGHMIVDINGRKCKCGRYGCVEAYCAVEAFEEISKEGLRRGGSIKTVDFEGVDIDSIGYKTICKMASKGNYFSLERLEETACILSTGLANTIGITNPEIVILSGELFDESEYFYDIVTKQTKQRLFSLSTQDVIFKKRNVKDNLYEIGAATLVYKSFFND